MSQRQFPRRLPITGDQRIHQIFMLVGHLLASILENIAEMKESLTFFKSATDGFGQPAIARSISDGRMEQVICLQVLGLAHLLKVGEACRAKLIEAAQVRGTHMSGRQLGSNWLDDDPEVEEVLDIAQGDGRDLISVPRHTAHEALLYQPCERLAHGRFSDPRLSG